MSKLFKPLFLFAFTFLLAFESKAQPAIHLNVDVKKSDSSSYEITVTGNIPQTWHLYGINHSGDGLTPIFNFDYENVVVSGEPAFSAPPQFISDPVFENKKTEIYEGNFSFIQKIRISGSLPPVLKGTLTLFTGKAKEFYPVEQSFEIILQGGIQPGYSHSTIKLSTVNLDKPVADCGKQVVKHQSLWAIFLLGFAGGLIALLTPCVFPMVPATVSFFTKRSSNRKAAVRNGILYGLFIFLIYILLSVPFHIIGNVNPEIFNTISTNAYLNILFFIVFIVFALSFFGFFEITLPGSLANKADEKGGIANIGGIFFMSLTLALVSFSCTGPILGSLLVGSLSGGVWPLTFGLAGFGIALGLPFGLFAVFPDWLKSLPKSGGWLDTVKKVLAFLEVALAFKFLSNADLVMHWGILKREVFIGIWILTGLGLTLYLFGLIRLPHDYKGQKIGTGRKVLGTFSLLFTLYLIPGITRSDNSHLNLLSGFPPPVSYSIYNRDGLKGNSLEADVINDYERAVRLSDSLHKPLLIDFTGWACVNCRKMEENVWNQSEVNNYIKKNYVLLSLYVDDRKKLPVQDRMTYTTKDSNKKDITTFGDKWATFEAENFDQVSQPFYVILNNKGALLNNPIGYTPDVKEYLDWLTCARESFDRTSIVKQ
jgi:thiol:disulfide interchange protein